MESGTPLGSSIVNRSNEFSATRLAKPTAKSSSKDQTVDRIPPKHFMLCNASISFVILIAIIGMFSDSCSYGPNRIIRCYIARNRCRSEELLVVEPSQIPRYMANSSRTNLLLSNTIRTLMNTVETQVSCSFINHHPL